MQKISSLHEVNGNVREEFDLNQDSFNDLIAGMDLVYLPGCSAPKGAEAEEFKKLMDYYYVRSETLETVRQGEGRVISVTHTLPRRAGELDFDCTCPDDGWPCKHAAAVAYLLAEHVDEHPLAVLTLRGVGLGTLIGGVDAAPPPTDDFYGDETELPELPMERFRPALEDLDPMLLRRALRAGGTDEAVVIRAVSDLEDLYRRLR